MFRASLLMCFTLLFSACDGGHDYSVTAGADAGTSGGGVPGELQPPRLTELMKMDGALHVMWVNRQPDCDTVRIERREATTDWAERFSVPGEADNKMDGSATSDLAYFYRLRCEEGGAFSAYSNELSANPRQ